jgi:hypothetical protein
MSMNLLDTDLNPLPSPLMNLYPYTGSSVKVTFITYDPVAVSGFNRTRKGLRINFENIPIMGRPTSLHNYRTVRRKEEIVQLAHLVRTRP